MEKKFISFIVALTVFVSIPIPVCSAEDWIYMGNYYDPSCYGSMRIYVDSDSMSLEDSSPGYSFIHKTGSLVKLLYSKYGQNYSSIWNISTNYYWHVNDSLAVGATLYWQPNHVYEYNTAGYLIGENDCRNEDERIAYQEYSVVDPGGHVRHVKSDKSYWPNNLIYDLDNFIYKYIKSGNRMKHIQGKKQDNLSEKDYPVPGISNGSSVSDSEVSLGGIPYQASESYVKSIYGNPTSNKTVYVDNELKRGYVTTWKYGDSVSVDFIDGRVTHVTVTANNGFATPAGAYVGMKESVLQRLYGDPRKHGSGTNGCSYEYYRSEKDDYLGIRFDCQDGIYNGTMN